MDIPINGPLAGGNQTFLRNHNTERILAQLRQNGPLSRVDLAKSTGLDKKTVTNIINNLTQRNMVRACDKQLGTIGRPKEMLSINGEYGFYAGIDLGGTHLAGVIIDFTGEIVVSHDIDLNNDMEPDTLIKLCFHVMDTLLRRWGKDKAISGIGIAFPGFVYPMVAESTLAENLPKWHDVPIKRIFEEKYDVPVFIENNTRMMTLAEMWFGKGRDCDNFIVVDLGLGIGCGIVADRKVFEGCNGKSGEIGHTIIDRNGPLCTCGSHGCIESLAAGWALSNQAGEALRTGQKTLLEEMCGANCSQPSIKQIVLAAELGDEFCTGLLVNAGEYIGIGISNAISFFNPPLVIIGGRLIKDNDIILDSILDTVKVYCMPQIYEDARIVISDMGVLASAWGAGIYCLDKLN